MMNSKPAKKTRPKIVWSGMVIALLLMVALAVLDSLQSDAASAVTTVPSTRPLLVPSKNSPAQSPSRASSRASSQGSSQVTSRPHSKPSPTATFRWNVVAPKARETAAQGFRIVRTGATLTVSFYSHDPKMVLNTASAPSIVLRPAPPVAVKPGSLSPAQWPKGSSQVAFNLSGVSTNAPVHVTGKISFSVCAQGTKNCKRSVQPLTLDQ